MAVRLPIDNGQGMPIRMQTGLRRIHARPARLAMGRMSTREVHLGLYNISDCAQVFFSYYIIGSDPQYFPGPLRFDQDRFTQPKPHAPDRPISPSAAASRQCIGEPFAWIEAVIAIATIARRSFRWKIVAAEQGRLAAGES
jgi:cytochrome P450